MRISEIDEVAEGPENVEDLILDIPTLNVESNSIFHQYLRVSGM